MSFFVAPNVSNSPSISVVTVVFNGAAHLEQCLQSVRSQVGTRHEHIVIDGGSKDGSVEIIRRYAGELSYWISESDHGIGDAMNKGIAVARGEWILFLQSDDFLLTSESLNLCHAQLARTNADVVCFPCQFGNPERFTTLRPKGGGLWLNLKNGLPHQSCFTRRHLFQRVGGFDANLPVNMDYDFFLRGKRAGAKFETRSDPIPSFMRSSGVSSQRDWQSLRRRFKDERRIHIRHANGLGMKWFYFAYWPAYITYRWLRWCSSALIARFS